MQSQTWITRARAFTSTPRGARISMWVSYFIFWAGCAAVLPFISVYYESIGIRGGQIGQLNSIPYFVSLFSSITFGFLSDVLRRHRLILAGCTLGLMITLLAFPLASTFLTLLPVVFAYSLLMAPVNPIMDQTALASLEDSASYGKLRVGGSIGWGIMVLVTGFLIDRLSLGLPLIFYVNIGFFAIFLLLIAFLPNQRRVSSEPHEKASLKKVMALFKQPGFLTFLFVTILWAIGESSIGGFLFLHIKYLGGSSTLMGTALSVSLIGEILVFSAADKIQARIRPRKMVLLAFVVLFIWLSGLWLIRNPNAIPVFQVFGGAGFALMQSGSVAYVSKRAPAEIGTTAQAIRSGLVSGFGIGTGLILNGMIYERAGSVILFRSMSFVVLGGLLIGVLAFSREREKKNPV